MCSSDLNALAVRLPRKALLIGADLIRAAVALCLPFIDAIWQVYLLIFILQAASATFTPAFQATIPDILDDEAEYTRALSLSRLAYELENLVSPALAGLLLLVTSYHWLFGGTVVGFLGSALLGWSAPLPARKAVRVRGTRIRQKTTDSMVSPAGCSTSPGVTRVMPMKGVTPITSTAKPINRRFMRRGVILFLSWEIHNGAAHPPPVCVQKKHHKWIPSVRAPRVHAACP